MLVATGQSARGEWGEKRVVARALLPVIVPSDRLFLDKYARHLSVPKIMKHLFDKETD